MSRKWKAHNSKLNNYELSLCPKGCNIVAGIDEAGRGPLAGPVVAGAVVLKKRIFAAKIFDSKRLTSAQRQMAFLEIIQKAIVGVGIVDREIIDEENILQATVIAIKRALVNLGVKPDYLLVDGRFKADAWEYPCRMLIGGDRLCLSIACASIIAKVIRDNLMSYYSALYPEYVFGRHRGYCTAAHLEAIKRYGLSPIHRRSFRPIRDYKLRAS